MATRDQLGRAVREAWVAWAQGQPDPKPSWLLPYDELSETDKEADRRIGAALLEVAAQECFRQAAACAAPMHCGCREKIAAHLRGIADA